MCKLFVLRKVTWSFNYLLRIIIIIIISYLKLYKSVQIICIKLVTFVERNTKAPLYNS